MIETIRMDPRNISIPGGVLASRLGFRGEKQIPSDFKVLYIELLEMLQDDAIPEARIDTRQVSVDDEGIWIGRKSIPGDLAKKHLSGTSRVTILIATLGHEVDRSIAKEEERGNTLRSFMIDGMASELVEFFVRELDSMLRHRFEGEKGRTRISPGYGDLPLELNEWIVDELKGKEIDVSCKEGSFQLIPRKTVSAFIGWRDNEDGQK